MGDFYEIKPGAVPSFAEAGTGVLTQPDRQRTAPRGATSRVAMPRP